MSEHRITAKLPIGKGGDTFKADLDYTYELGASPWNGAELELIKVTPLDDKAARGVELVAIADTWLQDEGYDMACELAERERSEGRE